MSAGLTPLKSLEELKPDDQPDVVLADAATITADLAVQEKQRTLTKSGK